MYKWFIHSWNHELILESIDAWTQVWGEPRSGTAAASSAAGTRGSAPPRPRGNTFILLYYITLYYIVFYYIILYLIKLYIMSIRIILCYIMLYYIILYHIISYHVVGPGDARCPGRGGTMPNLPAKIVPTKIYWLKLSWKFPMDLRIPPLEVKILLYPNHLKPRVSVRRLAGVPCTTHEVALYVPRPCLYPLSWTCVMTLPCLTLAVFAVRGSQHRPLRRGNRFCRRPSSGRQTPTTSIPPLKLNIVLESNPLTSRILVGRLGVCARG